MTRFFVRTGGASADHARDHVEAQGHKVVRAVLTPACSIPVYGICEVEAPAEDLTPQSAGS